MLPIVLSISAILISAMVVLNNRRCKKIIKHQDLRNHYTTMRLDIDNQLTANPKLWTIYDHHSTGIIKSDEPEDKGQRLNFLSYHFNLFESVYLSYNDVPALNKQDKALWEWWKKYMQQFFERSTEARLVFKQTRARKIGNGGYVQLMNAIIEEVENKIRERQVLMG